MKTLGELPTVATWWQTSVGENTAVWNRSDKSEHVGYLSGYSDTYEGDDKFDVFRGDGLRSNCSSCKDLGCQHVIWPEDHIGTAATEHEAALMVQEYCEDVADDVSWRGKPPIHRRSAKHPRAKVFMV